MTDTNQLFFIAANDDGDSLDLLVVAPNRDEARSIWSAYYELDGDAPTPRIGRVPGVSPTCGKGPINWDAIALR